MHYFNSYLKYSDLWQNIQEFTDDSENKVIWPDESDLEETMAGILRILHIYDLDLEEVHG